MISFAAFLCSAIRFLLVPFDLGKFYNKYITPIVFNFGLPLIKDIHVRGSYTYSTLCA